MEEKSKLFYDDLVGSGYKLPDYETFKTSLQDQTKADAFYKDLSSNGFKLPDFDTFYGVFKPTETVQSPIEQSVAEQPSQEQVIESIQYGPMGAIGLQRTKDYKPEIGERGAMDFLADNAKSLGVGISNFVPNTLETIAVGQSFVQNAIAKTGITKSVSASEVTIPIGLMNVNLFQASNEYRKKMEEFLPTDQAQKDSFWGQTFTALGEIVPVILSGFTAGGSTKLAKEAVKNKTSLEGAVKYGKELVSRMGSAQGVLTFSQVASPSYRQAIGDGATEMEATTYALQNALISLPIEMLPIQGMFKRLDQIIPGNKGVEVVKRALIGGTEEGLTEGFQNVYENLSANAIYDANKSALDGIGDAVAVGGTVGAILNGIMTALTGKRIRVKTSEEAEILDKAIEETQAKINKVKENNKKVEETVTALENTSERTLNNGATDLSFIENPDGSIEYSEDGLTGPDAIAKRLLLEAKYPNIEFQVVDRTDKKDPYAQSDFTVIGIPKNRGKYSKGDQELSKNQTDLLIQGAESIADLEGLKIDNDTDLQTAFESRVKELTPAQSEAKTPVIADMSGESVSVRVGDQNISGIVEVDEGGKATITQGDTVYEIPQDAQFTEFVRPVEIGPEGDFVVNGDSFQEARIVVENGTPKALLIRADGTTKAVTNPRIVEEIEYQIALADLDNVTEEEATQILKNYDEQRQTEAVAEEGAVESNETEDDRKLRETVEEIQLIEDLALMELEDIESQAKLVSFTPPAMKDAKVYLVKKNPDGSYSASLNGRKVARPEITAELGKLFEQKTGEDISKLQEQTNKLRTEAEQKLFPNAKPISEQQAVEEPGREEPVALDPIPEKPADKGADTEVQISKKEPSGEKITVFRGVGNNVAESVNDALTWVAQNEDVANNYARTKEDGTLDVVALEINKPQNPIELPYKLATDVRASDIGNNLRLITEELYSQGRISDEGLSEIMSMIRDFESKAGDKLELFTAKVNKKESSDAFSKIVQALGFDSVLQMESSSRNGAKSKTYGIFKKKHDSLVSETKIENKRTKKQDGKTNQNEVAKPSPPPSKSAPKKDAGGPKKASRKGRVPLDQRKLKGKELQASKLTPNTLEETVLSWFINRGRLSYPGLKSLLGGRKQGGEKSIQGEFNARRSYMRTPEKGGMTIEKIVEEIYNNLSESLTKDADSDGTKLKSAIENAILENISISQMADKLLASRGVDSGSSRGLPPVEDRSSYTDDAINQTYTKEEWAEMSSQDKADFLNEYFQYPGGSEYAYTAETVEQMNDMGFEMDQREDDIDFLSVMSDEELIAFEKGYEGVEAQFIPDLAIDQDRVEFTVFGERKTGVLKDGKIIESDGTIHNERTAKEIKPIEVQKQKVKDIANDLLNQIKEDKQGIIIDFEAKAKSDIKFFNTLRNLVIEYARLKGLQFNEFIADLQKLLGQKIDKKNREYLKSIWDTEKKATPKKNVMTENKSLTKDEQVKQGLEEILVAKEREAKLKLERERVKAAEAIKLAKDKGKAALEGFENIKKTMIDFIKMDLKDIPVDSFTKGELNRILTQINRARTDWSLDLAINQAYNIFAEAGKKKRIARAKEKVSQAKTNIKSGKIGVLQPNSPLDQMLRINPKIIPQRVFDKYESIISEVGARKTVLSPREKSELFTRVNEVMKEVDNDNSLLNSLKFEYDNYQNKGANYSETIMDMFKNGVISQSELDFMKLRKSEIIDKIPTVASQPTQAELDAITKSIIDEITNLPQPGNNFSKDENKIIRFFNSITKSDLEGMSMRDLNSVYSLMGNLENGYIPHLSEKFRQRVEGIRNSKTVRPIIQGFKGKWSDVLSKAKAGIKNKLQDENTSSMRERIRMNPLAYIDQSLRNFKNTQFYDSTFRKLASSYASFDSDFKTVLEKLLAVESKLKNQFESRSKMMMMAIQEEFESNPGSKVNSAKDWLDATISDNYSIYNSEVKKKLQDIFDSISTNGELDLKKAENSLSKDEKAARKAISEINSYLTPIADWTATVIRGNRVPIHENYIHLPRAVKGGNPVNFDPKTMGGPLNPSTRSGALIERTGKTHAISFDLFDNVLSGAKQTLMDYHMTPTVREMNETFAHLQSLAKTEEEVDATIQMEKVYEEALKNTIGTTMMEQSVAESVLNEITRKGYQSILAGAGKAMSELGTNAAFSGIFKLNSSLDGIKILTTIKSDKASMVVKNLGSSHSSRLYNTSGMDSRHVDFGGYSTKKLAKATGIDEGLASRLLNIAKENKYYGKVDDIQTSLMSSPDQMVSRPLWMGVFNENFKNITGKDPDFDKIASNDQDYMEEFGSELEKAKNEADDVVTEAVASSNPFEGILKNNQKYSKNGLVNYINTFNSFMTRFPIFEYNSAVRGVNALMGNGKMSRTDGAKLLTALTTRLIMYDLMTKTVLGYLSQKIAGLFSDQKEEEKEPIENILTRPFISSIVMLVMNRNLGNVAKAPINWAVELLNKEFGEGVTYEDKYDGFSDSVVYPIIPVEVNPGDKDPIFTLIENTSASMSPMVKTTFRGITVGKRALTSKTEEARDRNMNELLTRIPFEVAGNLGLIPGYKDFRKVMLDYWYNSEEKTEKEKEKTRKFGQK